MAKQVKLTAERRTALGRSAVRKLKAAGSVPAIMYGAKDKPEALAAVRARTPGGRLATTEDVVDAVKFLFNNKGVNGVNLIVDGGWILQ